MHKNTDIEQVPENIIDKTQEDSVRPKGMTKYS